MSEPSCRLDWSGQDFAGSDVQIPGEIPVSDLVLDWMSSCLNHL